ncbi:hypothetical protein [Aurantimonas sp. Leaf443]|uniref:hypothetical protein n=1 Tax=Aurantimonas sp. Leaf443 TaxID=1736378 RepID=UPI0006F8B97B|nr:hypothetical protein [Aurantimonas sp. Leaf443]KQT83124.1 hypothetical protein ASG48_14220 [Aurantimonas sp. Leaf443]
MSLSVENARASREAAYAAYECTRAVYELARKSGASEDDLDDLSLDILRAANALARAGDLAHQAEMDDLLGEERQVSVAATLAALEFGA